MTKGKKKTIVLLVVVIVVWGILGYKILSTLGPSEKLPDFVTSAPIKLGNSGVQKDTFSLLGDYRDPFLGTLAVKRKIVKKAKVKKPNVSKINVLYTGFVVGEGNKDRIYFVSINGVQQLMEVGQSIGKVKLIRGNGNYIMVRNNGAQEKILLKE